MTMQEFQAASAEKQAMMLYFEGIYIGKRRVFNRTVLLYQMESFYIEIVYYRYRRDIERIICSESTNLLEPYLDQVNVEDLVSS